MWEPSRRETILMYLMPRHLLLLLVSHSHLQQHELLGIYSIDMLACSCIAINVTRMSNGRNLHYAMEQGPQCSHRLYISGECSSSLVYSCHMLCKWPSSFLRIAFKLLLLLRKALHVPAGAIPKPESAQLLRGLPAIVLQQAAEALSALAATAGDTSIPTSPLPKIAGCSPAASTANTSRAVTPSVPPAAKQWQESPRGPSKAAPAKAAAVQKLPLEKLEVPEADLPAQQQPQQQPAGVDHTSLPCSNVRVQIRNTTALVGTTHITSMHGELVAKA